MKRSKCRRPDLSAIYADISGSASQDLCADESSEASLVDVGFVKGQPTIGVKPKGLRLDAVAL
jgi:hypothetical protein